MSWKWWQWVCRHNTEMLQSHCIYVEHEGICCSYVTALLANPGQPVNNSHILTSMESLTPAKEAFLIMLMLIMYNRTGLDGFFFFLVDKLSPCCMHHSLINTRSFLNVDRLLIPTPVMTVTALLRVCNENYRSAVFILVISLYYLAVMVVNGKNGQQWIKVIVVQM